MALPLTTARHGFISVSRGPFIFEFECSIEIVPPHEGPDGFHLLGKIRGQLFPYRGGRPDLAPKFFELIGQRFKVYSLHPSWKFHFDAAIQDSSGAFVGIPHADGPCPVIAVETVLPDLVVSS